MPGHSHSHFAESFEMYMKAVYRLEREGPGVTTSALATELGVAPASVSGMLKKLVNDGYVEHEVRGDIKLTRKGLEVAVGVVRRNRLAERLLTDVLGMPWDEVYAEACILEHAITPRVEERLIETLGIRRRVRTDIQFRRPISPNPFARACRSRRSSPEARSPFPASPNRCQKYFDTWDKSVCVPARSYACSRRRRSEAL